MRTGTKNGIGWGFIGEPKRTACSEIRNDLNQIPKEAWARDGEEAEEMDAGIFLHDPHDPEYHHVDLENIEGERSFSEEDDEAVQKEHEVHRHNLETMKNASVNLIQVLGLEPVTVIHNTINIYLREGAEGVIKYFFLNLKFKQFEKAEAVLEFFDKIKKFQPKISEEVIHEILKNAQEEKKRENINISTIYKLDISSSVKSQLIRRAQQEQSRYNKNNNSHLVTRLGETIFGKWKFEQLLRTTV